MLVALAWEYACEERHGLRKAPLGISWDRSLINVCLARIKSSFGMNNIQTGRVTCHKEEIQLWRSFGEAQERLQRFQRIEKISGGS